MSTAKISRSWKGAGDASVETDHFGAPWGMAVKIVTLTVLAIHGALVTLGLVLPRDTPAVNALLVGLPVLVTFACVAFTIRGYVLTRDTLYVQRLWWRTRVSLVGVRSVEHDPKAMRRSLRLLGNGGLFSIAGVFRNATFGRYRAFATDPKRSVVLRFDTRPVVVTPDRPGAFVAKVRRLSGLATGSS